MADLKNSIPFTKDNHIARIIDLHILGSKYFHCYFLVISYWKKSGSFSRMRTLSCTVSSWKWTGSEKLKKTMSQFDQWDKPVSLGFPFLLKAIGIC